LLTLRGIANPVVSERFDVVRTILERTRGSLRDGDVLVLSSKFLAISEGRVVKLDDVEVGAEARRLARRYGIDERLCELVARESDDVLGGVPGFLLASKDGLLTPNAGIDRSNIGRGMAVLYPRRPEEIARRVRESVRFALGISVAVVVCDSRLTPTRRGTIGVAIAASGLEAIEDMRGEKDLFGNVLKVTSQGVADDLSSAAELLMGESDEAIPMVVVSGLKRTLVGEEEYPAMRFAMPADECVYLRSLGRAGSQAPDED
jgi:coenzyme F420-0:L-glutamate ligase